MTFTNDFSFLMNDNEEEQIREAQEWEEMLSSNCFCDTHGYCGGASCPMWHDCPDRY